MEKYLCVKDAWREIAKERPYLSYQMVMGAVKRKEIKAFKTQLTKSAEYRVKLSDVKKYYDSIEENDLIL